MTTSIDDISGSITNLINKTFKDKKESSTSLIIPALESFIDKSAPNIIEWATRPEYLNLVIEDEDSGDIRTVYDHYGQYETLRDFFELLCPICATANDKVCWGRSREALESQPLLVWDQSYKDDVCPKCNTTRQEFQESGLFKGLDLMLLIIGMRSSKSTTSAIIASFIEHKMLTYNNIARLFGLIPNQLLEVSFVATTANQSEKTVFESWRSLRKNSPWIQSFIKKLKTAETYKGQYYEDSAKKVRYNHSNLLFESYTSNSAGSAGSTRVASFIDELARFDTTESKRSAAEVFRVFNSSLRTIRSVKDQKILPNCFGILCATTSPIKESDYAMRLGEKASELKNMYYTHKATWEFNPYQPFSSFAEEFKLDPVGSERDFGARPPLAESPFIRDIEAFERCIDATLEPTATFRNVIITDPLGREYIGKEIVSCQTDQKTKKVLYLDAGKSNDSFTMVCAHGEYRDGIWKTVYDFVEAITPMKSPKRTVSFLCIVPLIENLSKKQKISMARFDRWNSESIIQDLRAMRIDADPFSLKLEHYNAFLSDISLGKIILLPKLSSDNGKDPYGDMSAQGRALHEITHLERSLDLKKIDHRSSEHNDTAVGVIGANYLVQHEIQKSISPLSPQNTKKITNFGSIARFNRW